MKLWFSCRKCSFHLKDSYAFLVCWCYLVLPWGWTRHPCHHPSSIRATSVSSWESAIANFPADGVQAQISSVIRRFLGRFCFCFSWKQLEAVGSEPDEFHNRFSTMILGYFSMIVEEKRNGLYAYWHFHRSPKSLRAFGWFVGGASCAKSCFSGSTGPFSGTQYSRVDEVDQIFLVGQVMENLIRISKRRRYEFPKSTTGSRRNVLDLFVQSVKIGTARSFFLLNISTHHWKRLASFGSQMMPVVQNNLFCVCVCVLFLNMASWVLKFNGHWDLSEMYTSELAVSFSCRIYRSIIRDAQTHIVHRRLRCRCLFAAWLFWHACYLSFSSCLNLKRRIILGEE